MTVSASATGAFVAMTAGSSSCMGELGRGCLDLMYILLQSVCYLGRVLFSFSVRSGVTACIPSMADRVS